MIYQSSSESLVTLMEGLQAEKGGQSWGLLMEGSVDSWLGVNIPMDGESCWGH